MDPSNHTEPFLVFGQPVIGEEEIAEVVECLRSGWIGRGPRVSRFEEQFAAYKGVPGAAALHSCSAALLLSLRAAGVGPGDEVITTPLTYCATINAIIHAGARPVLADIEPATMNVDPAAVRRSISPRTRALIPVHFAGRPCAMEELLAFAREHQLTLIEDCAHAIETEYHGRKAGTLGDFGCFSFYPTKNVTTSEGGMVLANSADHLTTVRILAAQGMTQDAWKRFSSVGSPHYAVVAAGFKHNMTDLEAAIGIHQLARVEANWRRRERIWLRYREALAGLPVALPALPEPETRHAYHLFCLLIDEREAGIDRGEFVARMRKLGIGCAIHYRSATEQPYYQEALGWHEEDCPEALRTGRQTVSLPLSPAYGEREIERVVSAVRTVLRGPGGAGEPAV
jgi:dTDP-4-amino-4,6-dideoxygalactose transaminase